MSLGDMFLSIINNDKIISKQEIDIFLKKFNTNAVDIITDKCLDYWDIDLNDEDNGELIDKYFKGHIKQCDEKEYLENPYYKNIVIKNIQEGRYGLKNDHYFPYEIFALDDIKVDNEFVEHSSLGFFKDKFPFIALNENNVTWMSITPNEINTMKNGINAAEGDVLVYGLGLGYYAYMVSIKEKVKSVTIIEKDQNIIDIFNKYIYPQFKNKEKIKIIKSDALNYKFNDGDFDLLFIDLWKTPEDGISFFLNFKKMEKNYHKTKFIYWLNNSFYALIRRATITLLLEQLEGYKEEQYHLSNCPYDDLINELFRKTKNLQFDSANQIRDLLSDDSLIDLFNLN